METPFKCKYCNSEFEYDYVFKRHESCQCTKRLSEYNYDDRKQIVDTANRVLYYSAMDDEYGVRESVKLNKLMISRKDNSCYGFACQFCSEGFEYEREKISHEPKCIYRKFEDDDSDNKMEKPKITAKVKQECACQDRVQLLEREIVQLQGKITELRKQCEIVNEIRPQLEDLSAIKFQLSLLKSAALNESK